MPKAPEDCEQPSKPWLWSVARKSAEAGKEGGFLGFGGVAVSDAEKATLEADRHRARKPSGHRGRAGR